MLIPPPESQDALAKGIVEGATFPHEAGLAYDLASVVKYAIEPPHGLGHLRDGDEPGEIQFAAGRTCARILDKESGVAGAVSFGKAWKAQEKFARNLETSKKGLEDHHAAGRRSRQD